MPRFTLSLLLALVMTTGAVAQDDLPRANELLNRQDWAGAAELLQKAVAADPSQAAAWTNLGLALRQLGRLEEALPAYEQAIRKGDTTLRAQAGLALTQARLGRMENAASSLRKAVDQGMSPCATGSKTPRMEGRPGRPSLMRSTARRVRPPRAERTSQQATAAQRTARQS